MPEKDTHAVVKSLGQRKKLRRLEGKMMKLLLVAGLVLGAMISLTGGQASEREQSPTIEQRLRGVQLSLISHKRRYNRNDQLRLDLLLRNSREEDIYVFGTLDFGYRASVVLHIRDASGKEIEPRIMFDAPTQASPDDKEAFIKLRSNHFIGTIFFSPLKFLNLTKPGKYAIVAEYTCPFANAEVGLTPFYGKENGPLKSNVVWIEVIK